MKFTCSREELAKNLGVAQRATDSKSSVLVLRNVLFELKDGKLNLAGYDHRIGIRTSVKCEIEEEGSVTVPCGLLLEVLGVMSDPVLKFTLDGTVMTMECGRSRYNFNCIAADDFPPFPKTGAGKKFSISAPLLEKAVRQTLFATNAEDPRPFMGGVYIGGKDGDLVFVATDGHRMTMRKLPGQKAPFEDKGPIVPAKTMNELLRILPGGKAAEKGEKEDEKKEAPSVAVSVQDDSIAFEYEDVYMISRLVKAEYPNYEKVLPASTKGSVRVARTRLASAVRGVAVMARAKENQHIIDLNIGENVLMLHSHTQDVGSADEELEVDKKGNDIKVSFNSRYILDFLGAVEEDEVVLDYSEDLKATLFHTDSPDYKYVLMPIKI